MKLCIQNLSRVRGGNEKWLGMLAEGLAGLGHRVVVSCRGGSAVEIDLRARAIATTPVRPGAPGDLPRALAFARWLRRERPDALLLTSWRAIPAGVVAARAAGVPRVVVRLGIVRRPGPLARWAFRGVDALIVNAPEVRDAWVAGAPRFPPEAVHVVYNAVVPAPPDPSIRDALPPGPLLGGAGFIERRKGFDLLLEATARIPGVSVVLVGEGSQERALREQAARLGIAGRVHFAGYRPDAARILAACDIFVLPSRNEGMANVMLEAMASGVPVVAAGVSGVPSALGPDEDGALAGWVVPPEDAEGLAAALREVLARPGEARVRAAEARRRAAQWFGAARMVGECEAILFPTDKPG